MRLAPTRAVVCAVACVGLVLAALDGTVGSASPAVSRADWAAQIRTLSESEGSFDTDNLTSNERSYLHVVPALRQQRGGAYVGVGPDQNFSYIAAARPAVAFIIDIRRDNLLLHLLFKALFEISETREAYLGRLFGRQFPGGAAWRPDAGVEDIVAALDRARTLAPGEQARLRTQIDARIAEFGVPLSPQDRATIARFHRTFIDRGPSLQFQSHGRPPRGYYPTYRELLLETDREGRHASFLAAETDYQFVREMALRNLIVPVVGNLAGPSALAAVGRSMRERGEALSVLYVSNVELYLFQSAQFARYAETVASLPRNSRSVLVRSVFSAPGVRTVPSAKPGYASASVTQRVDEFARDNAARRYSTYRDLLGR